MSTDIENIENIKNMEMEIKQLNNENMGTIKIIDTIKIEPLKDRIRALKEFCDSENKYIGNKKITDFREIHEILNDLQELLETCNNISKNQEKNNDLIKGIPENIFEKKVAGRIVAGIIHDRLNKELNAKILEVTGEINLIKNLLDECIILSDEELREINVYIKSYIDEINEENTKYIDEEKKEETDEETSITIETGKFLKILNEFRTKKDITQHDLNNYEEEIKKIIFDLEFLHEYYITNEYKYDETDKHDDIKSLISIEDFKDFEPSYNDVLSTFQTITSEKLHKIDQLIEQLNDLLSEVSLLQNTDTQGKKPSSKKPFSKNPFSKNLSSKNPSNSSRPGNSKLDEFNIQYNKINSESVNKLEDLKKLLRLIDTYLLESINAKASVELDKIGLLQRTITREIYDINHPIGSSKINKKQLNKFHFKSTNNEDFSIFSRKQQIKDCLRKCTNNFRNHNKNNEYTGINNELKEKISLLLHIHPDFDINLFKIYYSDPHNTEDFYIDMCYNRGRTATPEEQKNFGFSHLSFHSEIEGLPEIVNFSIDNIGSQMLLNNLFSFKNAYKIKIHTDIDGQKSFITQIQEAYYPNSIRGNATSGNATSGNATLFSEIIMNWLTKILTLCLTEMLISIEKGGYKTKKRRGSGYKTKKRRGSGYKTKKRRNSNKKWLKTF